MGVRKGHSDSGKFPRVAIAPTFETAPSYSGREALNL